MSEILTRQQISEKYPSEWILIVDPQTDDALEIHAGHVLCHSKDRDEVYREAVAARPARFALLYTGTIPEGTAVVL